MQYIGKDVLTHGSLLHLDKVKAWQGLRSRAKQGIRKAQRAGIRVVESRDLSLMAKVWYDPDTLTQTLAPEQKLYLSYVGDELCGGIIVTPVTRTTLFYHYGGTNELGRNIEANSYLFWHIVEQFHNSEFKFLDVGVSFRPELQHYFQKYCTRQYPIIFRPPPQEIRPRLSLTPFSLPDLQWTETQNVAINTELSQYFEAEFTYLPSWEFALQSALRATEVARGTTIGVWCSIGERSYVELLNSLLGDRFKFVARDLTASAYLVCHRWGVLVPEVESLSSGSIPLIEDCRDCLNLQPAQPRPGSYGKFAVFDFARWFPIQFGAALVGAYFDDRYVWDNFHCLDVTKRNLVREYLQIWWPERLSDAGVRRGNWDRFVDWFELAGFTVAATPQLAPSVFLLKGAGPYHALALSARLAEFDVASEYDVTDNVVAIPCHGRMGPNHVDYIFGIIRGMVNPCYSYIRKDPDEVNS